MIFNLFSSFIFLLAMLDGKRGQVPDSAGAAVHHCTGPAVLYRAGTTVHHSAGTAVPHCHRYKVKRKHK